MTWTFDITSFWKKLSTLILRKNGKDQTKKNANTVAHFIDDADFIAIDFETATQKRSSACSVAIVFVQDERVIGEFRSLIKPPNNEYSKINIGIHGIRASDTIKAPTIKQIWKNVLADTVSSDKPIVAHNASFDMSVLRESLSHHGIDIPYIQAICTVDIAREMFPGLENHKLPTVAEKLGIPLNHHDPLSDATAAAKIMMAWIKKNKDAEEAKKNRANDIKQRRAAIETAIAEAKSLEKEDPQKAAKLYISAFNLIKDEHAKMRSDHDWPKPPRVPINRITMILEKARAYRECLYAIDNYRKYPDPVGLTANDLEAIEKRYSRVSMKLIDK